MSKVFLGALALTMLAMGCAVHAEEETREVSQGQEATCLPERAPLVVWSEELPDCSMCAGFDACAEGDVVHVQATPPRVDDMGNRHARMVVADSAVVYGAASCARIRHHVDWGVTTTGSIMDSGDYCTVVGGGADYTATVTAAGNSVAGDFRVELGTLDGGTCSLSCAPL